MSIVCGFLVWKIAGLKEELRESEARCETLLEAMADGNFHLDDDYFPEEITKEYNLARHTVIINDPVHAIIELDTDGTFKMEGMKSSFFMGITREMTDNPKLDQAGRPASAEVLSAHFKMFYN